MDTGLCSVEERCEEKPVHRFSIESHAVHIIVVVNKVRCNASTQIVLGAALPIKRKSGKGPTRFPKTIIRICVNTECARSKKATNYSRHNQIQSNKNKTSIYINSNY